jgi:hypothetical protein
MQFGSALLVIAIGIQFGLFVNQIEQGLNPTIMRPPGGEVFLTVGLSLVDFLVHFLPL